MTLELTAVDETTPEWVTNLRTRTLRSYLEGSELTADAKAKLTVDAVQLYTYLQTQRRGQLPEFPEKDLKPAIEKLDKSLLDRHVRLGNQDMSLGDWSLELFVETEMTKAAIKGPGGLRGVLTVLRDERFRRGAGLLSKAALFMGATYATAVALGYDDKLTAALWGVFAGGFTAGIGGELWKASTSFFLQPSTELLKVLNAQYTGGAEQWINHALHKVRPRAKEDPTMFRNDRLRVATMKDHGFDCAGMPAEDQIYNMEAFQRISISVCKSYGQLYTDTFHHGRAIQTSTWEKLQAAQQLIEQLEGRMQELGKWGEDILTSYKTAFLIKDQNELAENLLDTYDRLQRRTDEAYLSAYGTGAEREMLRESILGALHRLKDLGVSMRDIEQIMLHQIERARVKTILVTAITISEMVMLVFPENGRNLEPNAAKMQIALQRAFGRKVFVDRYLPAVQDLQRKMSFRNGAGDCAEKLDTPRTKK